MDLEQEKTLFINELKDFANSLKDYITLNNEWTIKGFIDVFQNIYTISTDTKIVSKILELHIFPLFLDFAKKINYTIELATFQNWYPDLTFISNKDHSIKFAVDLKTTYRNESNPNFCNGFTLGSHGEYFTDRTSSKNIQYPYDEYIGHFCLGIIYSRNLINKDEEAQKFSLKDLTQIQSVASDFIFFAQEKWKIASDKGGSGNTANIGSIQYIPDIINGNGVFINAGEAIFNDYWINYDKLKVPGKDGKYKKLTSFLEYLTYRGLPVELNNPKKSKKGEN